MSMQQRLFSVLFAHGEPLSAEKIGRALDVPVDEIPLRLAGLRAWLAEHEVPLELLTLDGRYQLSTLPEYAADITRTMEQRRSAPLTQASLEALAVIAYNQPVTRGFVEQVRGVDSGGLVASLQEKGLVEEAGRLELPGRPIVYQVTDNFLRCFGMSDLSELPTIPVEAPPEDFIEGQLSLEDVDC